MGKGCNTLISVAVLSRFFQQETHKHSCCIQEWIWSQCDKRPNDDKIKVVLKGNSLIWSSQFEGKEEVVDQL